MAQAPASITVEAPLGDGEIGYRELAAQRPAEAQARIAANRSLDADDPAALINLGTAMARQGEAKKAADCYRAAIASRQRYDLELADGTWMDSRAAGRLAKRMLKDHRVLALR
ncbi:MAG TPA: hypothetical protein VM055_07100 [Novosphingobium sp.]|nr:hypothetical protein [Novosphingobium sp.]